MDIASTDDSEIVVSFNDSEEERGRDLDDGLEVEEMKEPVGIQQS